MNVLCLNHTKVQCGVYQYGFRLFEILQSNNTQGGQQFECIQKSNDINYFYKEVNSLDEYTTIINSLNYHIIIYNYHSSTMRWLNSETIQKKIKNIGISHESNCAGLFDYIINNENIELDTLISRPIYENVQNHNNNNNISFINCFTNLDIPIFGSFGFGFDNKGFHRIIQIVNDQYDNAIIKLLIPEAEFGPKRNEIHQLINECRNNITKPGIVLIMCNDFLSNEEVVLFLKSNTMNIFLYDHMYGRGLSSVIDYAISAKKPIGISDSYMFRHIYSDEICLYKVSIRDCIQCSQKHVDKLFEENSNKKLIRKFKTILSNIYSSNMKVEVSIGEAIDKYSILELKLKKITDENKIVEIKKEMECLNECEKYKKLYTFYYKLLLYVNEKIWDMTDIIKTIVLHENTLTQFSELSNSIFEYNQKRFRIKNWFNLNTNSNLKEQKSYGSTYCKINFQHEETMYDKIPEINYLLLEYDNIIVEKQNYELIKTIFNQPTIIEWTENLTSKSIIEIDLNNFILPKNETIDIFEFEPIAYISGGELGDFIHQLSVINENFYKCGKKGILYIAQGHGSGPFRYGVEFAYNDTFEIVSSQRYIKKYTLYMDEKYDINLNSWRSNPHLYKYNMYVVFKTSYNVEWGKHTWLNNIQYKPELNDKIIINTTNHRWGNYDYHLLYGKYSDNIEYISHEENSYEYFMNQVHLPIKYRKMNNFNELCSTIHSSKHFIGCLSMPLAVAYAMHKSSSFILPDSLDSTFYKDLPYFSNIDILY